MKLSKLHLNFEVNELEQIRRLVRSKEVIMLNLQERMDLGHKHSADLKKRCAQLLAREARKRAARRIIKWGTKNLICLK